MSLRESKGSRESTAEEGAAARQPGKVKMSEPRETSAFLLSKVRGRRWTSGGAPEPLVGLTGGASVGAGMGRSRLGPRRGLCGCASVGR